MKPNKIIALSFVALLGLSSRLDAASAEQPVNISILGVFQGPTRTNAAGTFTRTTVKTLLIRSPNVVKAIALDLGDTNLINGRLLRKISDLGTNNTESIIIRKGTNETDVTSFFGGTAENDFSANNEVIDSLVNNAAGKTNLFRAFGLHALSLTTSNISFSLSGFGTAVGRNVSGRAGTNVTSSLVLSLTATGAGTFSVNIGGTNLVSGPAHGSFNTSPAIFVRE